MEGVCHNPIGDYIFSVDQHSTSLTMNILIQNKLSRRKNTRIVFSNKKKNLEKGGI